MILTDFTENAGRVAVPSGGVETVGILSDFEILNLSTLSGLCLLSKFSANASPIHCCNCDPWVYFVNTHQSKV